MGRRARAGAFGGCSVPFDASDLNSLCPVPAQALARVVDPDLLIFPVFPGPLELSGLIAMPSTVAAVVALAIVDAFASSYMHARRQDFL